MNAADVVAIAAAMNLASVRLARVQMMLAAKTLKAVSK